MRQTVERDKRPVRDTMSSVVIKATLQMLTETGASVAMFATEKLIPALEIQGLIDMGSEGVSVDEFMRWRSRCIKRAQRVLAGETPMPADWIITWMSVLPELYKMKCSQKIAAMQGLQWVRLPRYNRIRVESVEAEIDTITTKFGEVLASSAPAHDGVYDNTDDKAALKQLQNRLAEMAAYIKREIINIEAATGIAPDYAEMGEHSPLMGGFSVTA
ncbi:hypothetical protein AN237_26130 (plasmid) [Raoultella ornithinolytica]|uniref:hypothetical protein n=1 Tax=Raoultella ornithinolytica TaxID=54291 RepID=UPI00084A22AB|nr:hypothetical protein [Raoultella ornithinolytica]AOO60032.1 hypothetical protein AN237_26130 [Raoultella ornithinolytica]